MMVPTDAKAPPFLVLGLDCAPPHLVFDLWQDRLPTLTSLRNRGFFGPLRSSNPPVTVPAWMCMMTGQDPGMLGVYGFRNRRDYGYGTLATANGDDIHEPTVWDILGQHGKQVILMGVPMTYPTKPVRGALVACFLAPDEQSAYTWPRALKLELDRVTGGYQLDVRDFRHASPEQLLHQLHEMTHKRMVGFRHLLRTRPWDFAMMVEMGVDRLHHGFWQYMDPLHRGYVPNHPLQHAIRDYYEMLDGLLGELLSEVPENTRILVVSDHGARAMEGAVCVNELLIREGLLTLTQRPSTPGRLKHEHIDWSRTQAWGEGGYYSRIFLNVAGREPQGIVPPNAVASLKSRLTRLFEDLPDDAGAPLGSKVYLPEQIYRETRNIPPDLLVHFGDLRWRAVGSVGYDSIYTFENDSGPDGANHDHQGIFIFFDPSHPGMGQRLEGHSLFDIAPTILRSFGVDAAPRMVGQELPV